MTRGDCEGRGVAMTWRGEGETMAVGRGRLNKLASSITSYPLRNIQL